MDFVFTLHSHLPYVLNHGRWPHGSDWICEAAVDTYLPLLEALRRLGDEDTPAPVTIGFTPVLANQLASPVFVREMEAFFEQRLTACAEAPASLAKTGEQHLLPLVEYWRARLLRLRRLFHEVGRRPGRRLPRARGLGPARDHRLARRRTASSRSSRATRASGSSWPWARPSTAGCSAGHPRAAGCPSAPTGRAARGRPGPPRPSARSAGASRSTWPTPASATSSSTRTWRARAGRWACRAIRPRSIPKSTCPPPARPPRRRSARRTRPTAWRRPAATATSRPTSGIPAPRCRSGAGSRATPATAGTSSSTRCAGPAASSSGASAARMWTSAPRSPTIRRTRSTGRGGTPTTSPDCSAASPPRRPRAATA